MMTRSFIFAAAAVFALSAGSADAVSFSAAQGDRLDGSDVPTDRSDLGSLTDGDSGTFYSLGLGGSLSADISPLNVAGGSILEITNAGVLDQYPESAKIYLSEGGAPFDISSAELLGEIYNDGLAPDVADPVGLGSIIVAAQGGGQTLWELSLVSPYIYSMITLVETTNETYQAYYDQTGINTDGFDVGQFTVQPVPLPSSVLMLLGALGGLGFMSRRRRAEA